MLNFITVYFDFDKLLTFKPYKSRKLDLLHAQSDVFINESLVCAQPISYAEKHIIKHRLLFLNIRGGRLSGNSRRLIICSIRWASRSKNVNMCAKCRKTEEVPVSLIHLWYLLRNSTTFPSEHTKLHLLQLFSREWENFFHRVWRNVWLSCTKFGAFGALLTASLNNFILRLFLFVNYMNELLIHLTFDIVGKPFIAVSVQDNGITMSSHL